MLVAHRGNQGRAARDLGMHRNTLVRVLAELEIDAQLIRSAVLKNAGLSPAAESQTKSRSEGSNVVLMPASASATAADGNRGSV